MKKENRKLTLSEYYAAIAYKERMRPLRDIVNSNGVSYYVSTADTFDAGYETMIFRLNRFYEDTGKARKRIRSIIQSRNSVDWDGLYCENYATAEGARERHKYICANLEEFIHEKEK